MECEYNSLIENGTWQILKRPKNKKVLSNRWIFKIKRKQDGTVDRYKARLVARGHEQRPDIDYEEVFAPVAKYETVRTLLAASVEKQMHVHQMDVITAYIQGDLTEEIYMEQPEMIGIEINEDFVCLLKKPLYGLKQAGREWYRKLNNCLLDIGMSKTDIDPCVYVSSKEKNAIIIVIYIDDLLIASSDIDKLTNAKSMLRNKFKMKDLGPVNNILGINVKRNGPTGSMKLTQQRYVIELLQKFGMEDSKEVNTPIESNIKLTKEMKPQTDEEREEMKRKPYRELIGGLIYLSNATRPDLAFAASALSRFCADPGQIHWQFAKRVLRYLKGTINYGIRYEKCNDNLCTYVDSDWAGDIDDRKSCSGNVAMLAGGPISWQAKKQKSVALSTMEAEYMAMSEAAKEVIYLRRLLKHMRFSDLVNGATTVYCDSQSAIHLCKNSMYHNRSKHIDIRYHFSRETCEKGEISVEYLRTELMIADILTKSLPKVTSRVCSIVFYE